MAAAPNPSQEHHWTRTPITTRHSQTSLLFVSFCWGLGYSMPAKTRVPFSEVFPPDLERWSVITMGGYGAAMLAGAAFALLGERLILINQNVRLGWALSFLSHGLLFAVYASLSAAAIATGVQQSHGNVAAIISSLSRPVLWMLIAGLHLSFARLPAPHMPRPRRKKKRRLKWVNEDDDDE